MTFEEEQLHLLERYSVKGFLRSEYGYVIQPDGTIWSLTCKWTHGVILALLYPLEAIKYGYGVPDRDANVFHFQKFETRASCHLNCVRVGVNCLMTDWYVSKGNAPITEAQRRSLLEIFKEHEVQWNDLMISNYGDVNQVQLLGFLTTESYSEPEAFDDPEGVPSVEDSPEVVPKVATRSKETDRDSW